MSKYITQEEYKELLGGADKEKGSPKKRHKYNARKTEVDGIRFDSKKEAERYKTLLWLQSQGAIKYFLRQVPFHLPGGVIYRVDFQVHFSDGSIIYEDVKGFRTAEYRIKKKMVEALYPVTIAEV